MGHLFPLYSNLVRVMSKSEITWIKKEIKIMKEIIFYFLTGVNMFIRGVSDVDTCRVLEPAFCMDCRISCTLSRSFMCSSENFSICAGRIYVDETDGEVKSRC